MKDNPIEVIGVKSKKVGQYFWSKNFMIPSPVWSSLLSFLNLMYKKAASAKIIRNPKINTNKINAPSLSLLHKNVIKYIKTKEDKLIPSISNPKYFHTPFIYIIGIIKKILYINNFK